MTHAASMQHYFDGVGADTLRLFHLFAGPPQDYMWNARCIYFTDPDDTLWEVYAWIGDGPGDYHDVHNHPHAYLSGTYYVQVPEAPPSAGSRRDLRPGCITFYDPRGSVNMNAIKRDPYVEMEHTIAPCEGMILLWPSFLHHFVHPNLSEDPRISISYNVMLNWSNEYLPDQ